MTPIPRWFRTSRALRKRSFREDPGRADRTKHDHPGQHSCACTTSFFVCTVNRSRCINSDRITEEADRLPTSASAPFARPLQPARISARCAGPVSSPVWLAPGPVPGRCAEPASRPLCMNTARLRRPGSRTIQPYRIPDPSERLLDDSIKPAPSSTSPAPDPFSRTTQRAGIF